MKKFAFTGLRIVLALIMLWAFFDKVFGLGFGTAHNSAWIRGGSPTTRYLANAVHGPFAGLMHSLSGYAVIDWVYMLALVGIGLSLLTGIWIRFASICGAIFMVLIYMSSIPPENNPVFDEHIVYALVFLLIYSAVRTKPHQPLPESHA